MIMNKNILGIVAATFMLAACSKVCNVETGKTTPGSAEDFKKNVPDKVYFEFDSAKLTPAAKKNLDAQICWLKTYGTTNFTIEGHADERGTNEYNMALGTDRANSVSAYIASHGIATSRVTTTSFGKERPAVSNGTTEEQHALNRRAVTVLSNCP
jgi:peptidoglycan-associated lipoprotein